MYLQKAQSNYKRIFRTTTSISNHRLDRAFSTENTYNFSPENDLLNWDDPNVQRHFVDYASKRLNIKDMSDWYQVSKKDLFNLGGSGLVYNNNFPNIISTRFPDYEWLPWKFEKINKPTIWNEISVQRQFMDWAGKQLNVTEMSAWYKISGKQVMNLGGYVLMMKYNNSLSQLLPTVYPEYEWLPWKFIQSPKFYWDDIENQKKFMGQAEKELNIKEISDWYSVTTKDIIRIGGGGLIYKYKYSPSLLIKTLFPEYEWLPWKFDKCPQKFWESKANQRWFMHWVAKELKINEMSDWYKVSQSDFLNTKGSSLLNYYNTLPNTLKEVFPEYEWLPWKFERCPKHLWDQHSAAHFLEWAGKQLGVSNLQDWENISSKQILELGVNLHQKTLPQLISLAHPGHKISYIENAFVKKSQFTLKSCLKALFPKEEFLEEYRHPDIVFSTTGHALELDFFYPQFNLAFEYQGRQHYNSVAQFHRYADSLTETQLRDNEKVALCKQKGITLIEVPFWWNRSYHTLAATVYSHRPDLFPEPPIGDPIPTTMPTSRSEPTKRNPSNSTLMTSTVWDDRDPTGWFLTEKFDGMRLYWDGSQFFTRQGKPVSAPESIKRQLPTVGLDGELWTQYGLHQDAVAVVMSRDEEKWKKATFWVFDAPDMPFQPFEQRHEFLKDLKSRGSLPEFVKIVEAIECKSRDHLKQYFDEIIAKGGEGIMLREPGSLYKVGRSNSLRKYKAFLDTEVKVIANNFPHGFNCLQTNGKQIYVAIKDNFEEAKKVKEGSVITVKYLGTNVYGTLQYPQFYRERLDLKWEDL